MRPHDDELLSSWLHRLACANGVPPREFALCLGRESKMWSARLDRAASSELVALLERKTGVAAASIVALGLERNGLMALRLPLRWRADPDEATWLQFCPACLSAGRVDPPFFRKAWTEASRISCQRHDLMLLDRCPACAAGVASFDQAGLFPQSLCAICGFDLSTAQARPVPLRVRRLERLINDLLDLERAGRRSPDGGVAVRIFRLAASADHAAPIAFPHLSSARRFRLLDRLSRGLRPDAHAFDDPSDARFWERMARVATYCRGRRHGPVPRVPPRRGEASTPGRDARPTLAEVLKSYGQVTASRRDAAR